MARVISFVCLLALFALLATLQSAGPPRSAKAEAAKKVRDLPLVDRMYAEIDFPGIEDPKTTLAEALERLAEQVGVTVDIRESAFKWEMLNDVSRVEVANPNPIPPMRARLCDVLQKILDRVLIPSGATWLMRNDHIEITTRHFAEHDSLAKKHLEEPDPDLPPILYTVLPLVNADFRNTPLADALELVIRRTSQNIVLDQSVTTKQGESKVTARLRNVRVDTAVLLLASQAELSVAKLDNVYFVTTEEKAVRLEKRHAALRPVPPKTPKKKEEPGNLEFDFGLRGRLGGSGIWKEPKK